MVTLNTQTLGPCFSYEDTAGTPSPQLCSTSGTTYLFGHWEKEYKLDLPAPGKNIEQAQHYSAREASSQVVANSSMPPFALKYYPVNAQPLYRILGDADKSSTSGCIVALATGTPKSITIRHEQKGGTYPQRRQVVGAFSTKLHCVAELDKDFFVEETFNYWDLEDQDERPALATAPSFPNSVESHYQSILSVTYNGTEKSYIVRVEWTMEKDINAIAKEASSQILYPGTFKPHALFLHGVLEDNTLWDDYFHDTITSDITLKIPKVGDSSKYIQVEFKDVAWKKVTTTGLAFGGFQHSILSGVPRSIVVTVFGETTNWATHYP